MPQTCETRAVEARASRREVKRGARSELIRPASLPGEARGIRLPDKNRRAQIDSQHKVSGSHQRCCISLAHFTIPIR